MEKRMEGAASAPCTSPPKTASFDPTAVTEWDDRPAAGMASGAPDGCNRQLAAAPLLAAARPRRTLCRPPA